MQGEETKHPVVDRLKPINRTSEVTEGFLRGETGVTSAVPEPPYTMNELMGEMEEVTRETLAEKTHEPSPTPTVQKSFDLTKNTGIPTTPLVNGTKKLDISSSPTLPN